MPEGLAEKLRAARAERQMRGERRVITEALFNLPDVRHIMTSGGGEADNET